MERMTEENFRLLQRLHDVEPSIPKQIFNKEYERKKRKKNKNRKLSPIKSINKSPISKSEPLLSTGRRKHLKYLLFI